MEGLENIQVTVYLDSEARSEKEHGVGPVWKSEKGRRNLKSFFAICPHNKNWFLF